jgi:protein phosphatase
VVAASDIGLCRERNEDAFHATADGRVLAVADGLGGLPAGEVASAIAIGVVAEWFALQDRAPGGRAAAFEALHECFASAQEAILAAAEQMPGTSGMATTLVTALVAGSRLYAGHVGDVRAYRLGAAGLERLTDDHTRAWELVQVGALSEEEARHHRYRNALTRVLGHAPCVPALGVWDLSDGDVVLLCSDGLWDPVGAEAIARVLEDGGVALSVRASRLLDLALDAGGPDNVTLVAYCHAPATA